MTGIASKTVLQRTSDLYDRDHGVHQSFPRWAELDVPCGDATCPVLTDGR